MRSTMNFTNEKIDVNADLLMANTLRMLAVDAVQKANSGHPGLPLGAADLVSVLWNYFLKHNPGDPQWPDRDRFILSAGHGSALLYALLHLWGYPISLDDLRSFRQLHSKTPGHPEYDPALGIETTTGPLGQGFGNAVGMAIAERVLAARFNRPGYMIVDHFTYVLVGDGDLMEGVSHEAASLAGHLGLGRLIVLYDDNGISIDGSTCLTCSDDVALRFQAYGWQVLKCDGHNPLSIYEALSQAKLECNKPSIILCQTHIGYGSPRQDSSRAHGEPLGEEALTQTKLQLGWPITPDFYVPDEIRQRIAKILPERVLEQAAWEESIQAYSAAQPKLASEWRQFIAGELPEDWENLLQDFPASALEATRSASGRVLERLVGRLPTLIGGSADLTPSNNTRSKASKVIARSDYAGEYIHYGVREHAMGAIMNGLALHGLRPYGGTFLVFSDYMRPAIRMAAMMKLPVIYVFTHDSIGLGEDGPTHQPVEQLCALRAIPNLVVNRPADSLETLAAWKIALQRRDGPTALILSRQALPSLSKTGDFASRGAYILNDLEGKTPDLVVIGTGSELQVAVEAYAKLLQKGKLAQIISMPSWELFDHQTQEYKRMLLPEGVPVFAVEAGITLAWPRYAASAETVIGIDHFGASAPYQKLMEEFGFTSQHLLQVIESYFDKKGVK